MSDTEKQLREALKETLVRLQELRINFRSNTAIDNTINRTIEVLAETEPKHAACVAFDAWLLTDPKDVRLIGGFLAGYKAGMLNVADMVNAEQLQTARAQRIRDAAEKVPV